MENTERRLNYYYALINLADGMCVGVSTSITPLESGEYVEIDSLNEDYMFKYYNFENGKWYIDSAMTQEATELNK